MNGKVECALHRARYTEPHGKHRLRFYTGLHSAKMDIIFIDELRIPTLIGIYPREQAIPQTIEISLQIGTSTANAGSSDDIRDTIDYAVVVDAPLCSAIPAGWGMACPRG